MQKVQFVLCAAQILGYIWSSCTGHIEILPVEQAEPNAGQTHGCRQNFLPEAFLYNCTPFESYIEASSAADRLFAEFQPVLSVLQYPFRLKIVAQVVLRYLLKICASTGVVQKLFVLTAEAAAISGQ